MFKTTRIFPPGGWQYTQKETKWTAPAGLTFDGLVRKVIEHRLANPRFNLSTDLKTVEEEIQQRNGERIAFHPEYWNGEVDKKKAKLTPPTPPTSKNPWYAGLVQRVGKIRQTVHGAQTLMDWLGEGGLPVAPQLAQARARKCLNCPLNQDEGERMVDDIAQAIKEQTEIKAGIDLRLQEEEKLKTCTACGCHLPLKVWVPINHIQEHMDQDTQEALEPSCWVNNELAPLLVVIPFCKHDMGQAKEVLTWIHELGGCKNNPCLLVADCKIPQSEINSLKFLAAKSFSKVEAITTPHSLPNERWPIGPNWMFETTLRHVFEHYDSPFYWLEPDCIPLKPGWLEALQEEYRRAGKPFMGAVVSSSGQPNLPGDHLTGCAIYPNNAHEFLQHIYGSPRAFDMDMADVVLPYTHHTNQHHHFWGQMNLAPHFRKDRTPDMPKNTLLMSRIPKEAVVHHRNKDGSLIQLLRTMKNS